MKERIGQVFGFGKIAPIFSATFFLRSDDILTIQTTKNQNMAETKIRTSQV